MPVWPDGSALWPLAVAGPPTIRTDTVRKLPHLMPFRGTCQGVSGLIRSTCVQTFTKPRPTGTHLTELHLISSPKTSGCLEEKLPQPPLIAHEFTRHA